MARPMAISLEPVDAVTVATLVDNVTDLLPADEGPATRPALARAVEPAVPARFIEGGRAGDALRAEHGLSSRSATATGTTPRASTASSAPWAVRTSRCSSIPALPSFLLDGSLRVTGEVDRTPEFERGHPFFEAHRDGSRQPDPLILDDQALVARVLGRGLVVLTGRGHPGIVNILRHVRKLTGEDRIHAVIGGFI